MKKRADAFIDDGPEYVCRYRIRGCEAVEIHRAHVGTSPGSVVGIATGYGLDGPGIESIGARLSAPVQTGPGAHPASYRMGTGCFPGVKSGRSVTLTPHPLLVPWSKKSRAILLLALWAERPVQEPQCLYKGALYLYVGTSVGVYTPEIANAESGSKP